MTLYQANEVIRDKHMTDSYGFYSYSPSMLLLHFKKVSDEQYKEAVDTILDSIIDYLDKTNNHG